MYASPKIVIRQTGIGITATLDIQLSAYVPQSVYVLHLQADRPRPMRALRLGYILGVLNSRLMMYHFLRSTAQAEWQSFPRWTLNRITDLPVRAINFARAGERRLHNQIADLVEAVTTRNQGIDLEVDLNIERLVMDLYEMSSEERQRVWDTLREVKGVQSVTDLLPNDEMGAIV